MLISLSVRTYKVIKYSSCPKNSQHTAKALRRARGGRLWRTERWRSGLYLSSDVTAVLLTSIRILRKVDMRLIPPLFIMVSFETLHADSYLLTSIQVHSQL